MNDTLKKVLSISLALLILFQSLNKVGIVLSFKINQDYIAKVLCINRDKPEMKCQGKCVLMQRMKAEEEQEKQQLPQKLKEQQESVYCFDLFTWAIPCQATPPAAPPATFHYQAPLATAPAGRIFQPPRLLS